MTWKEMILMILGGAGVVVMFVCLLLFLTKCDERHNEQWVEIHRHDEAMKQLEGPPK